MSWITTFADRFLSAGSDRIVVGLVVVATAITFAVFESVKRVVVYLGLDRQVEAVKCVPGVGCDQTVMMSNAGKWAVLPAFLTFVLLFLGGMYYLSRQENHG